jgi:hypothetical protein
MEVGLANNGMSQVFCDHQFADFHPFIEQQM